MAHGCPEKFRSRDFFKGIITGWEKAEELYPEPPSFSKIQQCFPESEATSN